MLQYYIVSNNEHIQNAIATQHHACKRTHYDDVQSLMHAISPEAVIVCDSDFLPQLQEYSNEMMHNDCTCICVYTDKSQMTAKTFLQHGIVAAFHISECNLIPSYCDEYTGIVSGKVGIVDSNQNTLWGLSTIIKKFGYAVVSYADIDACCNTDETIDILCINCSQVSTEKIAKRYISGALPKKNAIVLYKSDEHDIYIHDIIKLNRLAKVMYTLEEVYIMLVKLLFTQQLHSYIYTLYDSSGMHSTTTSYRGNLRQWYLEAGAAMFEASHVFNSGLMNNLAHNIQMMLSLQARAQAFSWIVTK